VKQYRPRVGRCRRAVEPRTSGREIKWEGTAASILDGDGPQQELMRDSQPRPPAKWATTCRVTRDQCQRWSRRGRDHPAPAEAVTQTLTDRSVFWNCPTLWRSMVPTRSKRSFLVNPNCEKWATSLSRHSLTNFRRPATSHRRRRYQDPTHLPHTNTDWEILTRRGTGGVVGDHPATARRQRPNCRPGSRCARSAYPAIP
jgi:hypothetical protein